MPITTERKTRLNLDFTSGDVKQLLPAIKLIFGEGGLFIYLIDDQGFHISRHGDGQAFIDVMWVEHVEQRWSYLPEVVGEVVRWLESLDHPERIKLCGHWPTEQAYTRDPGLALKGYRVLSATSDDGQRRMLTITPNWV